MFRDLAPLSGTRFDVLVVGAGIHGAFIAWDAAQRRLRVAVIDAGGFGGATSANSLRVIHGGLCYLQQLNLKRVVESIREQAIWLSIAPNLVRPIQFMVSTRGYGKEGRIAVAAAMGLNDWLGADATRDIPVDHSIEPGEVVDRATALRLAPPLASIDFDGGGIWYDAQAANPERLTLAAITAAVGHGATAANYLRCEEVRVENGKVAGARLRDVLADASVDVLASSIVNATGTRLRISDDRESASVGAPPRALAVNLITRPVSQTVAFGVRSKRSGQEDPIGGGRRYLFLAPWRSSSLVGTFYRPWHDADAPRVSEELIASILDECNEACPGLSLTRADVRRAHAGPLPLEDAGIGSNGAPARATVSAPLLRRARIIEDSAHGGPHGLVSVFGIKYTTARLVAEDTVNVIYRTLGYTSPPCRTGSVPRALDMSSSPVVLSGPLLQGTDAASLRLRTVYGGAAPAVLSNAQARAAGAAEPLAPGCPALRAEVVHAVTSEMAVRVSDVVFRRTDLASEMPPADAALEAAADLTGSLLGWNASRRHQEVTEVRAAIQL